MTGTATFATFKIMPTIIIKPNITINQHAPILGFLEANSYWRRAGGYYPRIYHITLSHSKRHLAPFVGPSIPTKYAVTPCSS